MNKHNITTNTFKDEFGELFPSNAYEAFPTIDKKFMDILYPTVFSKLQTQLTLGNKRMMSTMLRKELIDKSI